ncbi:hypothetical protein SEA_LUNA18_60 [Microbacterium phage Luna18]|nr:hypothetical protein SEA_KATCHAN_59 [Microbacterium phage KatChan]URQ04910.1 hypothetical protein SEA_LUNA18_60 [Microbacterium phage Luna18]
MTSQEKRDLAYLRGYTQAVQGVAAREVTHKDVVSMSPDWHAKKLMEEGFHRGAAITDVQINRMAQYLYEGIRITPGITLIMDMTSKATLVKVLTEALTRADVVIKEES